MSKKIQIIFLCWLFIGLSGAHGFQYEAHKLNQSELSVIELLESGLASKDNVPAPFYYLSVFEYSKALEFMSDRERAAFPWLEPYLEGLVKTFSGLARYESEHFELWVPSDQSILADLALPELETIATVMERSFSHRPSQKIRVEIYPTKEAFSAASTLSMETLERSGAIGICKFHRLMVVSPKALPLGYRWIDALSHEYVHLMVNELSHMKAELWFHEGTARYFETLYRENPPVFLSPKQKTDLLNALDQDTLVPFERMSPSLVYLKDQDEVSLAFSQVSYSVSTLLSQKGGGRFVRFLRDLRAVPFSDAFQKNFNQSPFQFERKVHEGLSREGWPRTQGAMDDEVVFSTQDENQFVGAAVRDQIRLGDQMRRRGRFDAALLQYERALEQEPDNGVVLLKAAKMHLAFDRTDKAVELLRHATEKNPNYVTPYVVLASVLQGAAAAPYVKSALEINPFDPELDSLRRFMLLNPR